MKRVYLAGPIEGLHYSEATDWREYTAASLWQANLGSIDPMRGKSFLAGKMLHHENYAHDINCDTWSITQRDRFDVMRSDALLAYLGHWQPGASAGTLIELGWADAARIPIVVCTGENEHGVKLGQHPMVRGVAGWIVPSLGEAIDVLWMLLGEPT